MKQPIRLIALLLACVLALSLCACGDDAQPEVKAPQTEWYLGANNFMAREVKPEELFADVADTVNPTAVFDKLQLTEKMLVGVYALNNKEQDLKTLRNEIPFADVAHGNKTVSLMVLPSAVYLGSGHIFSGATGYKFSEFMDIDLPVAVVELPSDTDVVRKPCTYEISGNTLTFREIYRTSGAEEPIAYDYTGVTLTYDMALQGPWLTLSADGHSVKLKANCLTENVKDSLMLRGYSLLDSPLVGDLDYFASSERWNYAVRRDGRYYDLSAYKLDDEGRFTVYLEEKDEKTGEVEVFVEQYAYILQSTCGALNNDFRIILLDGDRICYYTDDITDREIRVLEEQGVDVTEVPVEVIKEVAETKSDLFDDFYAEFEAQALDVVINRSTGEIALDASVLFGGDSAEITEEGKTVLTGFLSACAKILENEKYDGFVLKLMVEGHTAPLATSTYESGLPLSQERADKVREFCLSAESGVDMTLLAPLVEAVGCSNSRPIYNSDGEVDLDACRRVSFSFVANTSRGA